CDPIYRFDRDDIAARVEDTYDRILDQTRQNAHEFVWSDAIRTPDDLGRVRMEAMRTFLEDYDDGRRENRYIEASLPQLPFTTREFDLALSSHFLFLYSEQLGEDFHVAVLRVL